MSPIRMGSLTLLLAALTGSAQQNVITVTGTAVANENAYFGAAQSSWTQTGSFSNVTIQATLTSCFDNSTGTAYLTLNGTNAGNQVATAPVLLTEGNNGGSATLTLFSGLNLGAGTYYLTILTTGSECGEFWQAVSPPTVTTGSGVTAETSGGTDNSVAAYAPASVFALGLSFAFTVTGTAGNAPAGAAAVGAPALSAWAFAGTALLLLLAGSLFLRRYGQPG